MLRVCSTILVSSGEVLPHVSADVYEKKNQIFTPVLNKMYINNSFVEIKVALMPANEIVHHH